MQVKQNDLNGIEYSCCVLSARWVNRDNEDLSELSYSIRMTGVTKTEFEVTIPNQVPQCQCESVFNCIFSLAIASYPIQH